MSNIDITPTTYKQTSRYLTNKLKEIETNLNVSIQGLIKSYPEYKLYPDVTELERVYNNYLYNLQDVKRDIFLLQNNLNDKNEKIKKVINIKNRELEKLKLDNKKLKDKYNALSESDQSSVGLRAQFEDEYRQKYLSLFILMLFTLLATFIGAKQIDTLRHMNVPKQINITK